MLNLLSPPRENFIKLEHAALVLVDIGGYTQFIRQRNLSLLHAEEIITQLLESVIDVAEFPSCNSGSHVLLEIN